ncbi:hypothetical protein MLD38_001848 [Melastoma candidum]|uniref:Uncharacterized protein n=1 Tax=Melastoma candidum TaxID=119954 RepID=A0ACB9SJF9_9MYRT|nr:hypothetical protein MLD38_001848 [Melastoma candidum]
MLFFIQSIKSTPIAVSDRSIDPLAVNTRTAMESMIKKYQQKFRKAKEEMDRWSEAQSRLISQFNNVSSIIERLPIIRKEENFGALSCVDGIADAVLSKQLQSLQSILLSMGDTLAEFRGVVLSLEKLHRDGGEFVRGGSSGQLGAKQLQQQIGLKPSLSDCLDGLKLLYNMHFAEYRLKSSIVSALPLIVFKSSISDLSSLRQLLADQPNIPPDEVRSILDIIFAEEIS